MSEFTSPNQEISLHQQNLFVAEINRLRPQLYQNEDLNATLESAEDEMTNHGEELHTFSYIENTFNVDGKTVAVAIHEDSSLDLETVQPMFSETFTVTVSELTTNDEGEHILKHEKYEVERSDYGEGSQQDAYFETELNILVGPGRFETLPTQLGRIVREQTDLLSSGQIESSDVDRALNKAVKEHKEFEETIGEYSHRFTTERFADVMSVLSKL